MWHGFAVPEDFMEPKRSLSLSLSSLCSMILTSFTNKTECCEIFLEVHWKSSLDRGTGLCARTLSSHLLQMTYKNTNIT